MIWILYRSACLYYIWESFPINTYKRRIAAWVCVWDESSLSWTWILIVAKSRYSETRPSIPVSNSCDLDAEPSSIYPVESKMMSDSVGSSLIAICSQIELAGAKLWWATMSYCSKGCDDIIHWAKYMMQMLTFNTQFTVPPTQFALRMDVLKNRIITGDFRNIF